MQTDLDFVAGGGDCQTVFFHRRNGAHSIFCCFCVELSRSPRCATKLFSQRFAFLPFALVAMRKGHCVQLTPFAAFICKNHRSVVLFQAFCFQSSSAAVCARTVCACLQAACHLSCAVTLTVGRDLPNDCWKLGCVAKAHRSLSLSLQGIDLIAGGRVKNRNRDAPRSENVYLRLIVKVRVAAKQRRQAKTNFAFVRSSTGSWRAGQSRSSTKSCSSACS